MDRNELKVKSLLNKIVELEERNAELHVDVHLLLENKEQLEQQIQDLQVAVNTPTSEVADVPQEEAAADSQGSADLAD